MLYIGTGLIFMLLPGTFLGRLELVGDQQSSRGGLEQQSEHCSEQDAQQKFGINGRTAGIAVTRFQPLPHKGKADVFFDQPQQMSLRNLIFQAEVVETALRSGRVAPS